MSQTFHTSSIGKISTNISLFVNLSQSVPKPSELPSAYVGSNL